MFRDAHNYFFKISKNIENYRDIAVLIGEQLYYSDDDLFSVVCKISDEQYKVKNPSQLPKSDKLELAKKMHYDYNAGIKQISRMLKNRHCDTRFHVRLIVLKNGVVKRKPQEKS